MKNDLIKVNYDSDAMTTSARSLWEFLERPYTEFVKWFNKYREYGFVINEDYRALRTKIRTAQGNYMDVQDYEITIDMAKELAMLQKTPKGKQARKYFIELEKQWNTPEAVMARAIKMATSKIFTLENQIKLDKSKVLFADSVAASDETLLVGELAKIIKQNGVDIGQNRLFDWMRDKEFLIKRKGTDYNMPTQKSMKLELFVIKERTVNNPDGTTRITKTPKVTGKGQIYFINKFIKEVKKTKEELVNV